MGDSHEKKGCNYVSREFTENHDCAVIIIYSFDPLFHVSWFQ